MYFNFKHDNFFSIFFEIKNEYIMNDKPDGNIQKYKKNADTNKENLLSAKV